MATMVDRPQSALLSSSPTIPQRRSATDIIDVDLLDSDDELQTSRRVRFRRELSVEVIEVSEGEDEGLFPTSGDSSTSGGGAALSAAPTVPTRNRNRNRLFSPPPRYTNPTPIPPVPRLAPHLASHASLPMRRHPSPHFHHHVAGAEPSSSSTVRPPVRAHDQPFDFEDAFSSGGSGSGSGRSRQPSPGSRVSSRGSSPVVLPPRLGLGGALISSTNARLAEERQMASRRRASAVQRAREHAHARTLRAVARTGGHHGTWDRDFGLGFGGGAVGNGRDQTLAHLYLEIGLMPMEWPPGFLDPHHQSKRTEVEYRKEFTHSQPPEAGFTFDFAAGMLEDGERTTSEGSRFPTTSVENPIIIDDEEEKVGSSSSSDSKGKGKGAPTESSSSSSLSLKTLLVCSHCRDPLLLGESASKLGPEGEKARRLWSLRCGHLIDGKCLEALSTPPSTSTSSSEQAPSDVNRKGKAKATAPPIAESETGLFDYRARLRSRKSCMPSLPSLPSLITGRKEIKDSDDIQETFEWRCPVANCGKPHTSVKIRGIWGPAKPKMGKGDGVIGVFV